MLTSLLRNASETAGVPGFAKAFALWESANDKLRESAARQALPLRPSLLERNEAIGQLEEHTLKVAGQALHYASEKKLAPLANKVRVRPSMLRLLAPEQRVQFAQLVHDTVAPLVPQLADYGVTAEELGAFQTVIDLAANATTAPREATVNRRAATAELREAFRAADAVVANHLTPLLRPLRLAHPGFYERYVAALEILNLGTRSSEEDPETDPVDTAAAAPAAQIKAA